MHLVLYVLYMYLVFTTLKSGAISIIVSSLYMEKNKKQMKGQK